MSLRAPIAINLDQIEAKILGRLAGMHWYTLIIEPGAWRRVAERADEMGYATYCPILREVSKSAGGRHFGQIVERPALGGYMFIDMPGPRRRFDLFTPSDDNGDRPDELPEGDLRGYVADCARTVVEPVYGCRGFITIDGSPVALHEAEIDAMRRAEADGEFDFAGSNDSKRVAKWVKRGVPIEIVRGMFAGHIGEVDKVEDGKIVVNLTILGTIVPVPMALESIRRVRRAVDEDKRSVLQVRKNRAKSVSQSSATLG